MAKQKRTMKVLFGMLIVAMFALGLGVGSLIALAPGLETATVSTRSVSFDPVQTAPAEPQELSAQSTPQITEGPLERPSPSDWVKENQIEMKSDGAYIHFANPEWAILANTNSMDPLFDEDSHLLQISIGPNDVPNLKVGDILSYQSGFGFVIVHRIIEIGSDNDGWYAITKGDNNPTADPEKVRPDMVRRITVGIIY